MKKLREWWCETGQHYATGNAYANKKKGYHECQEHAEYLRRA